MSGNILGEFTPFKIKIPENVRYWEDETTGVLIRKGKEHIVRQQQFRSAELKFGIMRNRVLLADGEECKFAFKGQIVHVKSGKTKNLITVIQGLEKGKIISKESTKNKEKPKLDKSEKNINKDIEIADNEMVDMVLPMVGKTTKKVISKKSTQKKQKKKQNNISKEKVVKEDKND